jgi:hypothetical protein
MGMIKEGELKTKGMGEREWGNGYLFGTHAGPSLLSQLDPSFFTSFMLVFFSWMPI